MRRPSQAVGKVEIVVRREELDFFFLSVFFPSRSGSFVIRSTVTNKFAPCKGTSRPLSELPVRCSPLFHVLLDSN